jgi:hypothetical protein
MLIGIYVIQHFGSYFTNRQEMLIPFSTVLGCALRVGVMSIANLVLLQYPYPIGYSLPFQAILGMLPVIALFNTTLVLYTIPSGYLISKTIGFKKV